MIDQFEFDAFISHSLADRAIVRKIAERLQQSGLRIAFEEASELGNTSSLEETIDRSRALILCVTESALTSGWVALERTTAAHRDPTNTDRQFIPLVIGDCEIPDNLRHYRCFILKDDQETSYRTLIDACKPRSGASSFNETPEKECSPDGVPDFILSRGGDEIRSISINPSETSILTGSIGGEVCIWDLTSNNLIQRLNWGAPISSVAWTPDGEWILFSTEKSVVVCDNTTYSEQFILSDHPKIIKNIASLPCSGKIMSLCEEGIVRIWDRVTLNLVESKNLKPISSVACSIDDLMVVYSGSEGDLWFYGQESLKPKHVKKAHAAAGTALEITRNGKFAVSGSRDKTVKIWNCDTQECLGTFEGHQSTIQSVSISNDGKLVASVADRDDSVRIWDVQLQVCVVEISREHSRPTSVNLFLNGNRIAVGFSDGSVCVYDLTEGDIVNSSRDDTRRYVNAKVVLIGEGTVGKTSLAHRLIDDEYVIKDRTHGMNVWRLDLPLLPDSGFEREALLWDLAGQEDYRLIHQLFLEQTALALLLINPQKEDPFASVGDWLKALEASSANKERKHDATRILVFSQTDVGGIKISNAKIDRFISQNKFANWLTTSAKTGENCSDKLNNGEASKLKALIAETIPWEELPWTSTPRLLAALKNAVLSLRDDSDIRFLRFSELAQRLKQSDIGDQFEERDLRTAITLLANHGLVHALKFGDLVLMRPDLINGYAAAVIRSARAHIDEIGCVLEYDIYSDEFDFTGVERLKHRPDEELLLRALVETLLNHSLCIAEETPKGRHLVFPSQYRREKDTPKNPDIFVSYSFAGEWQTIWTTLVVRLWYSQQFSGRELWRNAAEFESVKGNVLGLLINTDADGVSTISMHFDREVPDELKVIFIEYVHQHLAKHAHDIQRDRRYICQKCTKPVTDLDVVRDRLARNLNYITCQQCDERVDLVDFIEQRLKSDPIAQKILAMDEVASKQLDNQALEQILIGHMMAIAGEANQIFRPLTFFDHGIDGEVEFKDNDGNASGRKIYVQLKSGNSYLRTRRSDGKEIFDIKNDRHSKYWVSQPVDVYLVIRTDEKSNGGSSIRWMNVTEYLKGIKNSKSSKQIIFEGEKLDMESVWRVRDKFFVSWAQ